MPSWDKKGEGRGSLQFTSASADGARPFTESSSFRRRSACPFRASPLPPGANPPCPPQRRNGHLFLWGSKSGAAVAAPQASSSREQEPTNSGRTPLRSLAHSTLRLSPSYLCQPWPRSRERCASVRASRAGRVTLFPSASSQDPAEVACAPFPLLRRRRPLRQSAPFPLSVVRFSAVVCSVRRHRRVISRRVCARVCWCASCVDAE